MAQVHAVRCDGCGRQEDFIEKPPSPSCDAWLCDEEFGVAKEVPMGWFEVYQQSASTEPIEPIHLCSRQCILACFRDKDDGIPEVFRRDG